MFFSNIINRYLKKTSYLITVLFLLIIVFSVFFLSEDLPFTLDGILDSGELTVITLNNAHCYYIYRDQKMGFEYDLAKEFSKRLGVNLKVETVDRWEDLIPALLNGKGAFVAANLTATARRKNKVAFSRGYMPIQQHLIIHRNNRDIRKIHDLAGKTIYVREGSPYQYRLEELIAKGETFNIQTMKGVSSEELIQKVNDRKIEITAAYTNIALLHRRYYPKAILSLPISEKEYLCWAVNPRSKKLLNRINVFLKKIKDDGTYTKIYNKYYSDIKDFDYVDISRYHRKLVSDLPKYSPVIKEAASFNNFDWRLIAAQIYQESHFNRFARSHAEAYGLMQLTYSTADSLGIKNILDPVENINGGVKHLKNLYDIFDIKDETDRLYIALAAYNVGQGHIQDAQELAEKMNLDPNKWSSLEKTLPLLQKRKYYQDTKYGYCRGIEPITYIRQIMIYYDILKHQNIEYDINVPSMNKNA